jgi:hypothetical protein
MAWGPQATGGVDRPRHPQQSPFYRLVERFVPKLEAVYEKRYQQRYDFCRPTAPPAAGRTPCPERWAPSRLDLRRPSLPDPIGALPISGRGRCRPPLPADRERRAAADLSRPDSGRFSLD